MKHLHQNSPRIFPCTTAPSYLQARAGLEPASAEDWLDFLSVGLADLDVDLDAPRAGDDPAAPRDPALWVPGSRLLSD